MGKITDLVARRNRRPAAETATRFVNCTHCGERHPIVRLAGGVLRCVTAFRDGELWFCRNRGCRAAWLREGQGS